LPRGILRPHPFRLTQPGQHNSRPTRQHAVKFGPRFGLRSDQVELGEEALTRGQVDLSDHDHLEVMPVAQVTHNLIC
jgi:hypothetical protein